MFRLIKALVALFIFAFLGIVIFAYLGDLAPQQSDVSQPVSVNVGQ